MTLDHDATSRTEAYLIFHFKMPFSISNAGIVGGLNLTANLASISVSADILLIQFISSRHESTLTKFNYLTWK